MEGDFIVWYKVLRLGLLVGALYYIIWFLYFSKKGKKVEEPARRILEEDDR